MAETRNMVMKRGTLKFLYIHTVHGCSSPWSPNSVKYHGKEQSLSLCFLFHLKYLLLDLCVCWQCKCAVMHVEARGHPWMLCTDCLGVSLAWNCPVGCAECLGSPGSTWIYLPSAGIRDVHLRARLSTWAQVLNAHLTRALHRAITTTCHPWFS